MNCYTFSELHFKKGVYDKSIDATYIITMEHSIERHKNITNQLKKLQPTKLVYIVFNKGFRKCDKILPENNTKFDLIHYNLEIILFIYILFIFYLYFILHNNYPQI